MIHFDELLEQSINPDILDNIRDHPQDYSSDKCMEEVEKYIREWFSGARRIAREHFVYKPVKDRKHVVACGKPIVMAMYLKQYDLLKEIKDKDMHHALVREQTSSLLVVHGTTTSEIMFEYLLWLDEKMPKEIKMWLIGLIQKDELPKSKRIYMRHGYGKNVNVSKRATSGLLIKNIEEILPYYEVEKEAYLRADFALFSQNGEEFIKLYQYFTEHINEAENADFFVKQIFMFLASMHKHISPKMRRFMFERLILIYNSKWYSDVLNLMYCRKNGIDGGLVSEYSSFAHEFCVALCGFENSFAYLIGSLMKSVLSLYYSDSVFGIEEINLIAAAADWYLGCVKKQPELDLSDDSYIRLAEDIFCNEDKHWGLLYPFNEPYIKTDNIKAYIIKKIKFIGLEKYLERNVRRIFTEENVEFLMELYRQNIPNENTTRMLLELVNERGFVRSIPIVMKHLHDEKARQRVNDSSQELNEADNIMWDNLDYLIENQEE